MAAKYGWAGILWAASPRFFAAAERPDLVAGLVLADPVIIPHVGPIMHMIARLTGRHGGMQLAKNGCQKGAPFGLIRRSPKNPIMDAVPLRHGKTGFWTLIWRAVSCRPDDGFQIGHVRRIGKRPISKGRS